MSLALIESPRRKDMMQRFGDEPEASPLNNNLIRGLGAAPLPQVVPPVNLPAPPAVPPTQDSPQAARPPQAENQMAAIPKPPGESAGVSAMTGGIKSIGPAKPAVQPYMPTPHVTTDAEKALGHLQESNNQNPNTGGISQIKSPWARTPLRILDAIGSVVAPRVMQFIPGTTMRHNLLVDLAENRVGQEQAQAKNIATTNELDARAQEQRARAHSLLNPKEDLDTPFKVWRSQNPDAPAEKWLQTEEGAKYHAPNEYADFKAGYLKDHPQATGDEVVTAFSTRAQKDTLPDQLATAVSDAMERGVDPMEDPTVKQLVAVHQAQQKPGEPNKDNRAIALMTKQALAKQGKGAPLTTEEQAELGAYNQWVKENKIDPGVQRAQIFVSGRMMPALDTGNGNAPTFVNPPGISKEPDRFMPAGVGVPALTKTALLEDIRGGIAQTRQSLQNVPPFSAADRVKIAFALRNRDTKSGFSALANSLAMDSLTETQQQYLIDTFNLVENIMAMRSTLGAGQGSDEMRAAIIATIPGPTTPSKDFGLKQLDVAEKTLDRISRGVPEVKLRGQDPNAAQGGGQSHGPAQGGYRIGGTYQGQEYLGGDPNDQKNWRKR